jgi:predicted Zn-dependent peptidase
MEKHHLAASSANAMLTEGTLLHDAMTLNDLIDSTGAVFNHTADKDSASLVVITLSRKLDEVMDLAAEVLFKPSFPEDEFRMLMDKRLQSFLTGRQKTSVIGREQFYQALCGKHNPYGKITRAEDYESITTVIVSDFHSQFYRPENMYITVSGKEPDKAIPVLEKLFTGGGMKSWQKPVIPDLAFETAPPGRIFAEVPGSVQSSIRLGWRSITRNHPDYHGLQVANMILGGYFGSRLMRNIREEKGYTYGIHSVAGSFHGIGFITIMTEVANEYREETIREIRKEIHELRRNEVGTDEMQIVRNHLMGEIARMFDGPFNSAEAVRSIIDYDTDRNYFSKFIDTVEKITPGKIKELFITYFNIADAIEIVAGA